MLPQTLDDTDAKALVSSAVEVTLRCSDIAERRAAWLDWLLPQIGADGGFWCWGRGHPLDRDVTPVATVVRGLTQEEWFALANAGLTEEATQIYRQPYVRYLERSNLVCLSRSTVWSDEQWTKFPFRERTLKQAGFENWLIAVRYVSRDTWCCLSMHRRFGRSDFSPRDVALTAVALGGIPWLWAQAAEQAPDEQFSDLTPRQRMVLLCLLDGLSRKQIAGRLGITVNTVNDHVKSLFQRFDVQSAPELAARFLKSQ